MYSRGGRRRSFEALIACDRMKRDAELEVVGGDGFLGLTSPVALLSEGRVLWGAVAQRRTVSHRI